MRADLCNAATTQLLALSAEENETILAWLERLERGAIVPDGEVVQRGSAGAQQSWKAR
jgi:hypothetical protein